MFFLFICSEFVEKEVRFKRNQFVRGTFSRSFQKNMHIKVCCVHICYTFAAVITKIKNSMRKKLGVGIGMLIVSLSTFAGGLLTNTNQHVLFLRNLARDASTEIDAVYSNPAGLAFMPNGLHLSFNGQSAFQTRTITSTFAPFAAYGGDATKKFKGEASAPFIPSLFAVYKNDRWAFSGNFAVTGGGGKATFNKGLGSFESQVALIPAMLNANDLPTTNYSVDSYMEGRQYIFGLQMGATYKITDNLAAFGGLRVNYVSNGYVGYIRNIKVNPNLPVLGFDGTMIPATQVLEALGQDASGAADKELDCDQTGWGGNSDYRA